MKKRRLTKARIKFLSLVPRGANRLPTILKEDGGFEVTLLTKGLGDNGELNAIVYAPEFRDSQGDIACAAVIKEMAYEASREGVEIDLRHNNKPVGRERAYVAETFIVQKNDPRFSDLTDYDGKPVDPTGSWGVVVKIDDPELRRLYKEGGWQGISMAGTAEVVHEKEDTQATAEEIVDLLAKRLNLRDNSTQEKDMPLSEADLAKINESTATIVAKAIADVEKAKHDKKEDERKKKEEAAKAKKKVKKTDEAPEFEGDSTKPEDVQKHLRALKRYEMEKDVDWSDPESVAEHAEGLATLAKEESDTNPELAKAKADLVKAQARLKKINSASRQSTGTVTNDSTTTIKKTEIDLYGGAPFFSADLQKMDEAERNACLEAGARMAAYANGRRGY